MIDPYVIMPNAAASLSAALGLPSSGNEQDWDIELADENRVEEFVLCYQTLGDSPDKKVALLALILASYDAAYDDTFNGDFNTWDFNQTFKPELWHEIEILLRSQIELSGPLINYWGSISYRVGMIVPFKIQALYSELSDLL